MSTDQGSLPAPAAVPVDRDPAGTRAQPDGSIPARLRRLLALPSPTEPRPVTPVPAWLLWPGLVALAASVALYLLLVRREPIFGLDLQMYRGALNAFLDGEPVYRNTYTALDLPYTYPPITLAYLSPLAFLSQPAALAAMHVAGMLALLLVLWRTTGMLGHRGTAGRLGLACVVAAALLWTEPLQLNFSLGQVNMLIIAMVVVDLSLPDHSRLKGIGIGLATASKLLPGLFVVYLLLTRRFRAAALAAGTFVALTAGGWLIQPAGSIDYWVRGLAFDSHRVLMTLGPRFPGNQSLQGLTARLLGTDEQNTVLWMICVAVAAAGGLAFAAWAHRRGEEVLAMVAVGTTTLLISPVSWSHYWLWLGPALLLLVDVTRRGHGRVRLLAGALTVAAFVPFAVWPIQARAGMPHGFIWAAHLHRGLLSRLLADPYIPTMLALAVLAAWWLRRSPLPATAPQSRRPR